MKRILAFDSGVGGFTALAPLLRKYSGLEVVYLGDLANLPYGTKSPEHIRELTGRNLSWLFQQSPGADLALVACNTASAHAMPIAKLEAQRFALPILGVIEAGCREAIERQTKRIVVLATAATVGSDSYPRALRAQGYAGEITQRACPLFVPLVEDELFEGAAVDAIARRYLDDNLRAGDTAILGCTHYPFLEASLRRLYPNVHWVDAGAALLHDSLLQKALAENAPSGAASKNRVRALFTDEVGSLREKIENYFARLNVTNVDLNVEIISASTFLPKG